MSISSSTKEEISLKKFKEKVINDFRTISLSREISVQGRREVLLGKGKFGIFGDGKEYMPIKNPHNTMCMCPWQYVCVRSHVHLPCHNPPRFLS